MKKLCKTCKFWFGDRRDGKGLGECDLTASDKGEPRNKTSLAVAHDTEGYHAWLVTDANFGCVQWEGRQ